MGMNLRLVLPMVLLLAGCQSQARYVAKDASPQFSRGDSNVLYVYAGSRQCSGGGKSIASVSQELKAAGIEVVSAQCGHDGRMYAATCGNPDGEILVVKVPGSQSAAARRMGWRALDDLPEEKVKACR